MNDRTDDFTTEIAKHVLANGMINDEFLSVDNSCVVIFSQ